MPRLICLALILLGIIPLAQADAQSRESACPVAGKYWVAGRLPNATTVYRGRVTISRTGNGCRVEWDKPNQSKGAGRYENGILTVDFRFPNGSTGVVTYTRAADNQLHGIWWMNNTPSYRGEETLSPNGPPQLGAPRSDLAPPPVIHTPPPPPRPAATDSWTRIEDDDRHSLFMKSLGASADNSSWHVLELWVEYDEGFKVEDFTTFSHVSRVVLDCSGRRYRSQGDATAYAGRNRSGQGYAVPMDAGWQQYLPDQHRWFRITCRL